MQDLFEDQQTTGTGPEQGGCGCGCAGSSDASTQSVGGGLTTTTATDGMNAVEMALAGTTWTRADLELAISMVSLLVWLATLYYMVKS